MRKPEININFGKKAILKFLKSCSTHKLTAPGEKLLIAVSGGSDSTAMALLSGYLKNIRAFAYIDHGLRLRGAKKEKDFVRRLAVEARVPFYTRRAAVRALAKRSGKSLEDAGRELRYGLLAGICKKRGYDKILTGHTLSDRIETFFIKFLRGGGLPSFYGIRRKTRIFSVPVVRPLLDFTREELKNFLKLGGKNFKTDESNSDNAFLRNRIRRRLIPYLKKNFCPGLEKRIAALAGQADELSGLINGQLSGLAAGDGILDIKKYLSYNTFLRKCFLAEFLEKKANYNAISEIDDFIARRKGGRFVLKDMELIVKKSKISLKRTARKK